MGLRRPASWVIPYLVAGGLAVLLAGVLLLPRLLYPPLSAADLAPIADPERRVVLQQAQSELQNDARGILLQGFGGLLLVAGALATWRQVTVNRQGQITERFTRAVDHLGSDNVDVRLGGVYALERVARNSYEDRASVAAILAAFVRTHSTWDTGTAAPQAWMQTRAPDVQGALGVLGRRPPSHDEEQLRLSYTDLRRSYLRDGQFQGVEFRHATFAGAVMRHCAFDGADLYDCDMSTVHARGASFVGASLGAANLTGADLSEADLRDVDLRGADLSEATLEGADLTGARGDEATRWPAGHIR